MSRPFASIGEVVDRLATQRYLIDEGLATAVFLAGALDKPLFVEGEPGVGKTELAKTVAAALGRELIRLQCYEGLDVSTAVYEWNYSRQLLHIRTAEAEGNVDAQRLEADLFTPEFLLPRPLLRAVQGGQAPPVLLIDELDRADDEFDAFLLELLAEYQVTIPELGTIRAERPPFVIITSNRTREVHDALKRRCLYAWVDYPPFEKEREIVLERVPGISERLSRDVVAWVQALREEDLYKRPGVAETLDWAAALAALDRDTLDPELVDRTLGVLLKHRDDVDSVRSGGIADRLAAGSPP